MQGILCRTLREFIRCVIWDQPYIIVAITFSLQNFFLTYEAKASWNHGKLCAWASGRRKRVRLSSFHAITESWMGLRNHDIAQFTKSSTGNLKTLAMACDCASCSELKLVGVYISVPSVIIRDSISYTIFLNHGHKDETRRKRLDSY